MTLRIRIGPDELSVSGDVAFVQRAFAAYARIVRARAAAARAFREGLR